MAFMPKLFEQEFRFCPFKVHVKAQTHCCCVALYLQASTYHRHLQYVWVSFKCLFNRPFSVLSYKKVTFNRNSQLAVQSPKLSQLNNLLTFLIALRTVPVQLRQMSQHHLSYPFTDNLCSALSCKELKEHFKPTQSLMRARGCVQFRTASCMFPVAALKMVRFLFIYHFLALFKYS